MQLLLHHGLYNWQQQQLQPHHQTQRNQELLLHLCCSLLMDHLPAAENKWIRDIDVFTHIKHQNTNSWDIDLSLIYGLNRLTRNHFCSYILKFTKPTWPNTYQLEYPYTNCKNDRQILLHFLGILSYETVVKAFC